MSRDLNADCGTAADLLPDLHGCLAVLAQPPAGASGRRHGGARSVDPHPQWRELSSDQARSARASGGRLDKFDFGPEEKMVEIAAKYPNMSPEGKQRFHEGASAGPS